MMQLPLQIAERDLSLPDETRERMKKKAAALDSYYDRIKSCRVIVEAPHRHPIKGVAYNVRIEIAVPGKEIVVTRVERCALSGKTSPSRWESNWSF